VAVAYYAGAEIGLALTIPPATTSILWPPNSILTAAFLLVPVRSWWVCLLAALPVHIFLELGAGFPPLLVGALFLTNSSEALIAASGLRLLSDSPTRFDTFRRVAAFIGCAAIAAPVLSSFADAAVVHGTTDQPYWLVWRNRTFANVLTELSIVPLFVTIASGAPVAVRNRRMEALALAVGLTTAAVWVFGQPIEARSVLGMPPMPTVMLLPFFFWSAIRFGVVGVSAALLVVACVLSYEGGLGYVPFYPMPPVGALAASQVFLAVIGTPLMCVAGLLEERRQAAADLAGRLRFESLLSTVAAACVRFTSDPVQPMISRCLEHIAGFLECDYVGLLEIDAREAPRVTGEWHAGPADHVRPVSGPDSCPSTYRKVLAGEAVEYDSLDQVHPESAIDRETLRTSAIRSMVVLPLESGNRVYGVLIVARTRAGRWTSEHRLQLTLVAEVLANACARRRTEWELQEARHSLAHVARVSSMGELTAALAHQLNQPLAGILTNAQAARLMLDQGRPDLKEIGEVIDDIIADDHRAASVIRRVRDMLTPGTSDAARMDINGLVDNVSKLVANEALLRNVSLGLSLAEQGLEVTANRIDLEQVLLNVLTNAIDAVSGGPATRRRVDVRTLAIDGQVQILVRDCGPGLPAGAEHRIFEPFFSTKKSGMGMGLAVARSLVEQAGGSIRASNHDGGGAEIAVSLPRSSS
jgi:signal transduction histidine kinase/integral membrane sensor domain MASE1